MTNTTNDIRPTRLGLLIPGDIVTGPLVARVEIPAGTDTGERYTIKSITGVQGNRTIIMEMDGDTYERTYLGATCLNAVWPLFKVETPEFYRG